MTRHMHKLALLGAGLLALVLGGCPVTEKPAGQVEKVRLVPFTSRADMLLYFQGQVVQRMQLNQRPIFGGLPFVAASSGPEGGGASAADNSSQGEAFTTTNLQEAGVDESDVFKSDGTYFYVVRDQSLRVLRARPMDRLEEIGRLDLDVVPTEIYLYGNKLILLATRYGAGGLWYLPTDAMWPPYFESSKLYVLEIDIRNPEAPRESGRVEIDGNLVSSRLTNGRLIAVLTVAPDLPASPTPLEVSLMGVEDFMPTVKTGDRTEELVDWQDCYHPEVPDGYFMTTVVTLDADNVENILHTAAVVANAGTVYASTHALYLTDTDYDAENNYRETTVIHKFGFDEDGLARYTGSGAVPGRPINQFSLSEYEGFLRIATQINNSVFWGFAEVGVASAGAPAGGGTEDDATAQDATPPSRYSAVYVLGEQDGELAVKGGVENVSPNEDLYAARFLGPRGYLITFERIDPLVTLDLSDPTDPRVAGELVVPGYSEYLHPLGDDYLIGVGRSTTTASWGGVIPAGVQLTLFDVSDLSNPTMVDHVELGDVGSWTEVSYTHKAFTFLEEADRLALPVMLTRTSSEPGDEPGMGNTVPDFNGVVAFHVDPATGFEELARLAAAESTDHPMELPFYGQWQRAAFIGETLYSISPEGVTAALLSDPANTVEVPLGQ